MINIWNVNGLHRGKGKGNILHTLMFEISDSYKFLEVKFINDTQCLGSSHCKINKSSASLTA